MSQEKKTDVPDFSSGDFLSRAASADHRHHRRLKMVGESEGKWQFWKSGAIAKITLRCLFTKDFVGKLVNFSSKSFRRTENI